VDHLPAEACRWLLRKPFSLDDVVKVLASAIAGITAGGPDTTPRGDAA